MKNLRSFIPEADVRSSHFCAVSFSSVYHNTAGKDLLVRRMLLFSPFLPSREIHITHIRYRVELGSDQGVTKRRRLSWLTNRALVYVADWVHSMSTAVHRSPNKVWRSKSIFNLCMVETHLIYIWKMGAMDRPSAQPQLIAQYFLIENQYIFGPRIGNSCT